MTTIEEIRAHFAALYDGLRKLDTVSVSYPAYSLRFNGEYGVAVEFDSDKEIHEESTNAMISTRKISIISGEYKKYLLLTCYDEEFRNEFAILCDAFTNPGINGELRDYLLNDPLSWWDKWIGLLGDRKNNKKCYDIIAEMIILSKILEVDKSAVWAAQEVGSHDIECDNVSYEVKSTIKKSDLNITISSQHQLSSEKPLYLTFVRMEKSKEGVSINEMKVSLVNNGYDSNSIENYLVSSGFIWGSRIREEKYKVLEIRKYIVDDDFPKITKDSFANGIFPESISKLIYSINLSNIKYDKME